MPCWPSVHLYSARSCKNSPADIPMASQEFGHSITLRGIACLLAPPTPVRRDRGDPGLFTAIDAMVVTGSKRARCRLREVRTWTALAVGLTSTGRSLSSAAPGQIPPGKMRVPSTCFAGTLAGPGQRRLSSWPATQALSLSQVTWPCSHRVAWIPLRHSALSVLSQAVHRTTGRCCAGHPGSTLSPGGRG